MPIRWIGPYKISDLLANCTDPRAPFPPTRGSAYLVTHHAWSDKPTSHAFPLYAGGNTGKSARFRTRVGDLIADILGFFTETRGHHSGGRSIRRWTLENGVHPLDLHLAWVAPGSCHRCLEVEVVGTLKPLLNKKQPAACPKHRAAHAKKPA